MGARDPNEADRTVGRAEEIEESNDVEVATAGTVAAEASLKLPSHFKNEAIPKLWRYGVPVYLLGALLLLLASDIGSGVTAEYILIKPDGSIFEQRTLLTVSIFNSVKKLWEADSYALAILIAVTSIMWPYIKLILSLVSWVVPFKNIRRREHFLEVIDALGKWSFVDIFVLLIIMVAFRQTIAVGFGVQLEIVIYPLWGFYGFVTATILSLLGTHTVLYFHRLVQYDIPGEAVKESTDGTEEQPSGQETEALAKKMNCSIPLIAAALVTSFALHIAGCVLETYEVIEMRPTSSTYKAYSVVSVGLGVPDSTLTPNGFGTRWVQAMFLFLAVALPLWNTVLFAALYLYPMTKTLRERLFVLTEITFSWACIEVMMISAVFSVLQIPSFGNGLIDAGCDQCLQVGSKVLPTFSVLAISAAFQVGLNFFLYRKAHGAVYPHA